MAALDSTLTELKVVGARVAPGRYGRLVDAARTQLAIARASEYLSVGGTRRFQASQRRKTRVAARVGLLVIAAAVGFDAVAMLGLDFESTRFAIGLDLTVLGVALLGSWSLGGRTRRHPELIAWVVTIGVACSTVTTGTLVPSLAVETIGYILLVPGVVALLLPWRTRTHLLWLLAYGVISCAYFAAGNLERTPDERGDLIVVLAVALGASVAGHVLLQRAQIRNFAQLERIGRLRRKSDRYMVELERLHHALELTAQTDPLTGTGNRRRLAEDLRAVRAHIARSSFTYGIAELDLDHFKLVNDRYGHAGGDDVLQQVAHAIKHSLRAQDAIYRLGGEEFLVLLSVPDLDGLTAAAERLRTVVADLAIEHIDNGPHGTVSVSIGATFIGPSDLDQTDDEWIARADAALYEAKDAGRNRVCVKQR
jgi:diguanylate cyclase (GGDEF)-like protein